MVAEIYDNGRGYSEAEGQGYGLRLTNDRIKLVNEMLNYKALEMQVVHSNGATCRIIFNDWL
jgi:hypothetical protein